MENVVPVLLGIFFIMFTLRMIRKFKTLEANGQTADGVVDRFDISERNRKTAIVKFKTADDEWISQPNSNAILSSFIKVGDNVRVLYYREDPTIFLIKTKYTNLLLGVFGIAGTALIIAGLLGFAG